MPTPFVWRGRVVLAGDTGFKASWLEALRAEIHGLALGPPSLHTLVGGDGDGPRALA